MATIMVSLEGQSIRRSSGKPKKVLRTIRRKHAQLLLNQLRVVFAQDGKESRRASQYKYTPALVYGNANSQWVNAALKLIDRLEIMLKQTA